VEGHVELCNSPEVDRVIPFPKIFSVLNTYNFTRINQRKNKAPASGGGFSQLKIKPAIL
jgi:hypothetical protein